MPDPPLQGAQHAVEAAGVQLLQVLEDGGGERPRVGGVAARPRTGSGRRASSSLHEALARAEARGDRLEAALVEARRPLLARVLEALRRR